MSGTYSRCQRRIRSMAVGLSASCSGSKWSQTASRMSVTPATAGRGRRFRYAGSQRSRALNIWCLRAGPRSVTGLPDGIGRGEQVMEKPRERHPVQEHNSRRDGKQLQFPGMERKSAKSEEVERTLAVEQETIRLDAEQKRVRDKQKHKE